jgi:hypothetical protein
MKDHKSPCKKRFPLLLKRAGGLKMNHIYVILSSGGLKTEQKTIVSE